MYIRKVRKWNYKYQTEKGKQRYLGRASWMELLLYKIRKIFRR